MMRLVRVEPSFRRGLHRRIATRCSGGMRGRTSLS
jgi:hypothetical protein